MFKFGILDFLGLKVFDNFGHLSLVDVQSRFELFSFIFALKILKFVVLGILL